MRIRAALALMLVPAFVLVATACATAIVEPNPHLRVEGVPPIDARLAARIAPYGEFRPRALASWHPRERALLVATRTGNTTQLNRLDAPLGALVPVTQGADPVREGMWWPVQPGTLVFVRDSGGNEQRQLYRLDAGASAPLLLTDPARQHEVLALDHARSRLLVGSTDLDKTGKRENPATDLSIFDPLDPARSRKVATVPGTGWGDASFAFDDRRFAIVDYRSVSDTDIVVIDVATGARKRVLPPEGARPARAIASSAPQFSRDGASLFLATDRDGEWSRAARLDLASGALTYFGPDRWDVEELAVSPDGRRIALVVNEAGVGALRLYDADTLREIALPRLPTGRVSRLAWRPDSGEIGFDLASAQGPSEVWSLDPAHETATQWTRNDVPGIDASSFAAAAPIEWKSFDGRTIGGFIVRPPARFAGPRPVVVDIHGGPEGQARPGFMGRWNYLVDVMGAAIVMPNVRGSTGYGKTFVGLDNGRLREDSVKDIGTLLDWIATQKDLDPARVVVVGGSYGGYMSLAAATHFSDRLAGAVDVVGIANFVTFLENTESYRRDLRRVEYGDERDPSMRAFLASISPVTHADAIRKPLLVAQGRNDPRVPYTESEQIVATARAHGVPVAYILADNEGHGFARKDNADYFFLAMIDFIGRVTGTPTMPRD